jgi:hypothetical protein
MENKEGYVYILSSVNSDCVKIGGSDYPPMKRINEINSTKPYKSIGPWTLSDFRQVTDWRKVEYNLHYQFRSKINTNVEQQKELFYLSIHEASMALNEINPEEIINKPKIDRMFQDKAFLKYIAYLFSFTGLLNWLNIQGAWTFVLFPSTSGGRYFTLNIGPHEVAFSILPRKDEVQLNMILVDRLIFDFGDVINWIASHNGKIEVDHYATALARSTSLMFYGTFDEIMEFYSLDGVRRALIAYWNEALINLKEKNTMSVFARHHNYNAVAKIHNVIDHNEEIFV